MFKDYLQRQILKSWTTPKHALAIKSNKIANDVSPKIMSEVFKLRDTPCYNLRHTSQFSTDLIQSVYNGTESASYLGPKIWEKISAEIKNKKSHDGFKRRLSFEWAKIFKTKFPENTTFVIISLIFWNNQWNARKILFIVSMIGLHTSNSKIRSKNWEKWSIVCFFFFSFFWKPILVI